MSSSYRKPQLFLLTTCTLLFAFTGIANAGSYTQNFDNLPDGTTDLGDGSVITGAAASVRGGRLQLTIDGQGLGYSSFTIPAVTDSSLGWTATWDYELFDSVANGNPADGFSFNYGNFVLGEPGGAEEGMANLPGVTTNVSFETDTYNNGDPEQGVSISGVINGQDPGNLSFTNGVILNDGQRVTGSMTASYDAAQGTVSFTTTGLNTNANFINVALPAGMEGDEAFNFGFSARVGGANQDLFIDNLVISTQPSLDSDNDGLPDHWEERYGLDPEDDGQVDIDNGPDGDPDEDGVNNEDEYANKTNPIDSDTDADGLSDGAETNTGVFVSASNTGTDPKEADTDGDGLNDGVETNTGVFVNAADTGTDPLLADTDGDGSSDGIEVDKGTDPTDDDDSPDSWLVRNAQSGSPLNSIADTRALFDGLGNLINETTTSHLTINFRENANGPFPNAEAFPLIGAQNGDANDYAIKATGTIFIDEPGSYTFGFNSDDGGGLWIDGNPVVVADVNRGSSTSVGAVELALGNHEMEFLYWERGGGAQVQLFVHNQLGDFSGTVPDNNQVLSNYRLLETSAPNDADDDGDLLPDWWENIYANNLTSLNGLDGSDFDEDGLTDFDEYEISTDPTEEDTDADGLEDGVETNTGIFASVSDTGTDPLKADTDSDGLNDGAEVLTHSTNPHIADSDGDEFSDSSEVAGGTDPNNEDSMPGLVFVDLSFPPLIGGPGAGQDAYRPNLEEAGLTMQENHYAGGILFSNQTAQNYDRVALNPGDWPPTQTATQVQPYFDHGNGGFITPSGGDLPYIDGGGDNFSIRVNGYVLFTNPGEYTIYLRADDTNYFVIDTPEGTQSANHNWISGVDLTLTFNVSSPGYYPFDNVMVEQSGGDWGDISITGPGIPQRVALGDVDAGSPKIFTMKLNPADTDNDFLPDWWEVQYANTLTALSGLDDSDFDEDTLTDFDEFENGTDPTEEDTDADGLEDGVETNSGTFVSASDTGTDPLEADTDSDGLNDGAEVLTHGTNPHIADTDGDGASDGAEITAGTDPLNDASVPGLQVIQPSFLTILDVPLGAGFEANLNEPGLTMQENHYPGGVLAHNNTNQNWDRVVVNPANWPPTRTLTAVQPYFDHGNGGFNTPGGGNLPYIDGGGDHFSIRVDGYVLLEAGNYTIHLGADDTNYFLIDTPDGPRQTGHNCCPNNHVMTFNISIKSLCPFANLMVEEGGGDWGDVSISGPGFARVALGDVAGGSPPVYTIQPASVDTDNDLLPDWWETGYAGNLTALNGVDNSDFDEDGLTDYDEFENGTDPTEKDTDGDGLDDNVETNTGTFVSASDTGTNPKDEDSDGDGLKDGDEITAATDPNNADSDGDGFSDGLEVNEGSDPNNPQSKPAVAVVTIIGGLIGGDLTDPENDGIEGPTIPGVPQTAGTNFNWLSISASSENYFGNFGGSEGAFDIFDNMVGGGQSKWCCNGPPQNATVEFEEPVSLTHFTITSGNDTPDRDPRDWQIQGSNDGINFEPIFVRASDEVVWTARDQTVRVDLPSASGAYKFIRYEVTRTIVNHQINEIEYFGVPGGGISFEVTAIDYNPTTEEITITWPSRENKTYSLFFSQDLLSFDADIDDSIPAAAGETTTFTFSNPIPGAQKIFFKVYENEG
jgi:hypothetical protein